MATKALFWALEQRIPGGPKSVLIHLADWYNTHESAAWPTHEQLAEKSGWSRRTCQRHIDWLVKHKFVIKEKQMRGNYQIQNRYRLPIGVLVLQGGQFDAAGVDKLTQQGCQIDAPINTIKDTIKNTINGGTPQENTDMKISEVLSEEKKSKEEILLGLKKKGKFYTADSCARIWRNMRSSANEENGFQVELTTTQKRMLWNAQKRIGNSDYFVDIIWNCMSDWVAFTKHAEVTGGAFNCPINPSISFFCKFVEAGGDFSITDDNEYGVQLIAKPLTKQPETSKTSTTAPVSVEESQAIAEKYGL
jgi:hypothetical protein